MLNGIKRFLFFLYTFLLFSSCYEQTGALLFDNVLDEERWLSEICSSKYKGRKAGTEECNAVADYISQELTSFGYEVNFQSFRFNDSFDLRNVYVISQGVSDSLIVIGAHYDGAVYGDQYPAADDNGSGVVAVLSLCKALSESKVQTNKSILLAFWAAEEFTQSSVFNGSRFFINHFSDKEKIIYYCNLDCFAHKDQGVFFYYSDGCENVCKNIEITMSHLPFDDIEVIVKMNDKLNSDYVPFYQSGIPYFGWNNYDTSGFIHSTKDRVENISFEKIRKVVNMTLTTLFEM